jgi:seryl-tRNA synthetase
MLDIKFIRENTELVKQSVEARRMNVDIDTLLDLYKQRNAIKQEIEEMQSTINSQSKTKPTPEIIEAMKVLGATKKEREAELITIEATYTALLKQVPNMIHADTPTGGEEDYVVVDERGIIPTSKNLKDHETLLTVKNVVDFERGAKVVGSKFYYSKNDLVRLNMALLQYGMDIVTKHGFELVETPDMAKNEVIEGAGFVPRGTETQIYNIEGTDLSLIGTAEITMLGYHKDEILDLTNGPKRYAAISHCFRTEAGAYGRTSKGLYRVHQFTKLELFSFCTPNMSDTEHQFILNVEKEIADGLELAYRVIDIPSGDLGAPANRKYDLEAWMVMQDGYGEITSTSNCTDYQSRRMNIRHRNDDGEMEFVHTLNGTAVVLSRFPIAIIEQMQNEDGSVTVPNVLRPYLGGREVLFNS